MRIPPPNPLTTVCTWIAAIFIAVREGAAKTPNFQWLADAMSGWWSYLPVGVLTLAASVYVVRLWLPKKQPPKEPDATPEAAKLGSTGLVMDDSGVAENFVISGQHLGVHMKRGGVLRNGMILGGFTIGDPPKQGDS
jgi:hypothetical protein